MKIFTNTKNKILKTIIENKNNNLIDKIKFEHKIKVNKNEFNLNLKKAIFSKENENSCWFLTEQNWLYFEINKSSYFFGLFGLETKKDNYYFKVNFDFFEKEWEKAINNFVVLINSFFEKSWNLKDKFIDFFERENFEWSKYCFNWEQRLNSIDLFLKTIESFKNDAIESFKKEIDFFEKATRFLK